jgi:hypothetical protein
MDAEPCKNYELKGGLKMQKVFMTAKEVQVFFGSQQNDCISADQLNESRTYKARLSSTKRQSIVFHGKVLLWK